MSRYASKVVEQAKAWLGKKETDGSHKVIIDTYNGHKPLARSYKVKYTDAWCATFVSAVAIKLGYTDIIPTECGCGQMIQKFKDIGCWIENDAYTPEPGDVIFYDWNDNGVGDCTGWPDHVGYVTKVSGTSITVIEGNYDNAVKERKLTVNAKNIRGYGVPKYDAESKVTATVKTTVSLDAVAKKVIAGKYGNMPKRKELLEAEGYNYEEVKVRVNAILKGEAAKTSIYYPKYNGTSKYIDKVFKEIGVPEKYRGNWSKRKPIAQANGISNYSGTSIQNLNLVNLAKKGQLKKV